MSSDPVVYDAVKHRHPSLCSACIHRQGDSVQMLSGYCITASRCPGCGRCADLAMCVISKPLVTLDATCGLFPANRIPASARNHMIQPAHPIAYVNKHTSVGIQDLKNKLREHTTAGECGTITDEEMAAGRVIDVIKALPMGDWDVLCTILKKGLESSHV